MENDILECCVDSVESALNAARGGASRLELCADLPIGGVTPNLALYHQIRKRSDIRMHILIRPRFGDFCYSKYEMKIMCEEIRMFRDAKAQADGRIDIMAGGGVGPETIGRLYPVTGGTSYHMSGRVILDSPMSYRKNEVSMGLPSMSEYEIWRTSEENVREAVKILKKLERS